MSGHNVSNTLIRLLLIKDELNWLSIYIQKQKKIYIKIYTQIIKKKKYLLIKNMHLKDI